MLDQETANHVGEVFRWLYNHSASIVLVSSAAVGALFWAAKQYFATRAAVERLREENENKHDLIIEQMNHNHHEVLKTMLRLHGRDDEYISSGAPGWRSSDPD